LVEGITLLLMLDQPLPKVGQTARIEARKIRRQTECHLPAQVELQALHRLVVRHVVVKLQQQDAAHQRRWQARAPIGRVVHVF